MTTVPHSPCLVACQQLCKRATNQICSLALLLLWAGPSVGGSAESTNTPASPPGWLTQPMSLLDAVNIALRQNTTLLKGQSDLAVAQGVAVQTRAIALPKVRGASDYTHNEGVENYSFSGSSGIYPPKDEWAGGIRIIQSIYEGGRIRSALRAARQTKEQAVLYYQGVVADTLLEVRIGYYDVLLAEKQIIVQEASVKLLVEEQENTTRRFEAGAVPRFDVLRAEVEVANARPKLIRAKNAYRIAKNSLAHLLGYDIPTNIGEDIPMILTGKLDAEAYAIDLPGAIAQALARRPELGVLRKEESLRKEAIITAKAGYKPSVAVFAGYGARSSSYQNTFTEDVSGAIAGLEFRWEIFDGNLTRGKVIEAKANYDKAQYDLDDAMRRIELQVRTAYSSFLEAREVLESQRKVQEQAEEALRLAISRYDAGNGTQLDVLNGQTSLTEARTTQVQALHGYDVARARLERAIGQDVPRDTGKATGR